MYQGENKIMLDIYTDTETKLFNIPLPSLHRCVCPSIDITPQTISDLPANHPCSEMLGSFMFSKSSPDLLHLLRANLLSSVKSTEHYWWILVFYGKSQLGSIVPFSENRAH